MLASKKLNAARRTAYIVVDSGWWDCFTLPIVQIEKDRLIHQRRQILSAVPYALYWGKRIFRLSMHWSLAHHFHPCNHNSRHLQQRTGSAITHLYTWIRRQYINCMNTEEKFSATSWEPCTINELTSSSSTNRSERFKRDGSNVIHLKSSGCAPKLIWSAALIDTRKEPSRSLRILWFLWSKF